MGRVAVVQGPPDFFPAGDSGQVGRQDDTGAKNTVGWAARPRCRCTAMVANPRLTRTLMRFFLSARIGKLLIFSITLGIFLILEGNRNQTPELRIHIAVLADNLGNYDPVSIQPLRLL